MHRRNVIAIYQLGTEDHQDYEEHHRTYNLVFGNSGIMDVELFSSRDGEFGGRPSFRTVDQTAWDKVTCNGIPIRALVIAKLKEILPNQSGR
jgi:hypothetical protein